MKKNLALFLLAILVFPSVALASWWNPFSWNWKALFSEPEVENKFVEDNTVQHENLSTSTKIINNKQIIDNKVVNNEVNVAKIVSDYYQSSAISLNGSIELLVNLSTESNRYIQGIPRNRDVLISMIDIGFSGGTKSDLKDSVNDWANGYISDFTKLKNNIDNYSNEVRRHQNIILSLGDELRSKSINKSESDLYSDEIGVYFKNIDGAIDRLKESLDSLSNAYLKEKKGVGDAIYQASIGNIKSSQDALSAPLYRPVINTIPVYSPPINTYCNSYGAGDVHCVTYSH